MLKLSDFAGRVLREDDPDDLGRPTGDVIADAIDEGRTEEAKTLARNLIHEWKGLHDLYCDWIWDMLTRIARKFGEAEVYAMLRATQETWMMKRTWKGFRRMTVARQVALTAEMMRAHRCGPRQEGDIEVVEDAERYTIVMDPCGSGGAHAARRSHGQDPLAARPALRLRLGPRRRTGGAGAARTCPTTAFTARSTRFCPSSGAARRSGSPTSTPITPSPAAGTSTRGPS